MVTTPMAEGLSEARAGNVHTFDVALVKNWWVIALRGALAILFGLLALFLPGPTVLSLVLLFAAFSFVDGVFAIVGAVRAMMRHDRWGFMLFMGLISIAAAAVALLWPALTVLAFVLIIAAWAIVSGAVILAAAFVAETGRSRLWMAIYGVLSVIFGVLLVLAPAIGAIVLTWWIGAYAVVAGVSLLVLAFTLRSRRSRSDAAARSS